MSGVTVLLRKERDHLLPLLKWLVELGLCFPVGYFSEHWDQKFRTSYLWENSQVHFHLRLTFECHAMNSKLTDQVTTVTFPRPLHGHVDHSSVQSHIRTLIFYIFFRDIKIKTIFLILRRLDWIYFDEILNGVRISVWLWQCAFDYQDFDTWIQSNFRAIELREKVCWTFKINETLWEDTLEIFMDTKYPFLKEKILVCCWWRAKWVFEGYQQEARSMAKLLANNPSQCSSISLKF